MKRQALIVAAMVLAAPILYAQEPAAEEVATVAARKAPPKVLISYHLGGDQSARIRLACVNEAGGKAQGCFTSYDDERTWTVWRCDSAGCDRKHPFTFSAPARIDFDATAPGMYVVTWWSYDAVRRNTILLQRGQVEYPLPSVPKPLP